MKKLFSVLILATIAFTSVIGQNTQPVEPVKQDNPNAPVIKFESEVHNYGKVPINGDGSCQFKFTNTGKEPLILSNVKASCGCTVPSWPKEPIPPGGSGVIDVKYTTMNRAHTINKSITVFSNASNNTVILRLEGEVYEDPAAPKTE